LAINGKKLGAFFDLQKKDFSRCLHGSFQCRKEAIRAHSIQNAKVLDLLQQDNHVRMPQPKLSGGKELVIEFGLVGRNNASTFTGLCSGHDTELFKLIDTEALDVGNAEQMKQLAYRALMRELHTCLEGGYRFQLAHIENIKTGVTKKNEPDGPGIFAVIFWEKAWRIFRYQGKHFISEPDLVYHVIELNDQTPSVAVSSIFSVAHDEAGDIVGPMLNVVPVGATKTVAVVSYPKSQAEAIKKGLPGLFDESDKKKALSELILQRVENFVLAPAVYDAWTEDKKKDVLKFFNDSAIEPKEPPEGVDLLLF
jgi:hypothetical protein